MSLPQLRVMTIPPLKATTPWCSGPPPTDFLGAEAAISPPHSGTQDVPTVFIIECMDASLCGCSCVVVEVYRPWRLVFMGKRQRACLVKWNQASIRGTPLSPRSVPMCDCSGRVMSWHSGPQCGAGGLEAGAAESGAPGASAQACRWGGACSGSIPVGLQQQLGVELSLVASLP